MKLGVSLNLSQAHSGNSCNCHAKFGDHDGAKTRSSQWIGGNHATFAQGRFMVEQRQQSFIQCLGLRQLISKSSCHVRGFGEPDQVLGRLMRSPTSRRLPPNCKGPVYCLTTVPKLCCLIPSFAFMEDTIFLNKSISLDAHFIHTWWNFTCLICCCCVELCLNFDFFAMAFWQIDIE